MVKPSMYITCYCFCQSILFFISTWLLCIFYILFFSQKEFQHLFNKSEKGCKQNALCCSNHDWRVFSKTPQGHQSDANSIYLIAICHKWVCDIGIGKPFTSNKSTEKIMEERQARIRDGNDFRDGFNSSTKRRPTLKLN